jgi:LmbE family N-acetylglucosaminyl deacetylase
MKNVSLFDDLRRGGGTLLCIGAHSDDIEIGCGGTLQKILEAPERLAVSWVVFSATGERENEAIASAEHILAGVQQRNIVVQQFRNGFFPYVGAELKDFFETLKKLPKPDLIFTHRRADLHQDHRLLGELTWNTFRDHFIVEYEIPKYDGDLGTPNLFVTLTDSEVTRKADVIERFFRSQRDKQWFSRDTFQALCRLRGVECNSPTGLAEGFYARKVVVD